MRFLLPDFNRLTFFAASSIILSSNKPQEQTNYDKAFQKTLEQNERTAE